MYKKILFVFSLFLLVAASTPVKAELVAYYPFSEGSGNTATDASGKGHNGTSTNLAWIDGPPGKGKAVYFDGVNPAANYINCGTWDPSEGTNQLTVACWVRWDGPFNSTYQGIVAKRQGWAAGQVRWQLEVSANSPYALGTSNYDSAFGTQTLPQGVWTHIALTNNGTTGVIYINGVAVDTASITLGGSATDQIEIGADNPAGYNAFYGGIDEVRIYSTALSASEIMMLYSGSDKNPYATAISPTDGQLEVPINATLNWKKGDYAATHNVYFSTNFDDVNTAQASALKSSYQSGTTYDPGILPYNTTYYWRVDEVNSPGTAGSYTYTGKVWKFTTDLTGIPIGALDSPTDRIAVSASSRLDETQDPNKTIGRNNTGLKQGPGPYKTYYIDANLTTAGPGNMWLTNSTDNDKWIRYIFDKEYKLNNILVWNYNETTPLSLYGIYFSKFGIKDVNVFTTTDYGTSWLSPVQAQLKKGTELPTYQAIDPINGNDINMGGSAVSGVTLQAISNWSGGLYSGYGLGEVIFLVAPTYASNYTVTSGKNNAKVNTTNTTVDPNMPNSRLNWQKGRDGLTFASSHKVYIKDVDNDGVTNATPADPNSARNAVRDNTIAAVTTNDPNYPLSGLNMQSTYYWRVDEVIGTKTWMNNSTSNKYKDIQSFKTVGSRLVSNFEAFSGAVGGGYFVSSPTHGGSVAFRFAVDLASGNKEIGPVDPIYYNIGQNNWQPGNPTKLVLYFYGDPNNTGVSMYVKITDATKTTKIVYGANPAEEDTSLLKRASWTRWNVPLTGVTLSSVTGIIYGVDVAGGTGLGQILFDDLTLYRVYPAAPLPTHPDDANLIAYYPFNGNANDMKGFGTIYNGTNKGTVTYPASTLGAVFDKVMDVNGGKTNFVDLGDVRPLSEPAGSLSISFWAYLRTWNAAAAWEPSLMGNRGDDNVGWQIRRNSNNNLIEFTTATGANNAMQYCTSLAIPATNQWVHVVCIFDSANKQLMMYVNGSLVRTSTVTQSKIAAAKSGTNYYKTFVGARPAAAGTGSTVAAERNVNGQMDEVRFYNKVLTDGEVLYLSNPTPTTIVK